MDLRRTVEEMVPGENVSPDFSTYQSMADHWRGSVPVPSEAAIATKWAEIEALDKETEHLENQRKEIQEAGIAAYDMARALWDKEKGDSAEFDRIDVVVEKAKTDFPDA